MSRVLLTGANGFVGSHILRQLLDQGSSVRAVVRSQAKADRVRRDHPDAATRLDFAIVPDITIASSFDNALSSTPPFDAVIHTASPFLYRAVQSNMDFLNPAVQGTTQLLTSIKEHGPAVKRVVITSSCAAVIDFDLPVGGGRVYTSEDWNPVSWDEALSTKNLSVAYRASKKYAELAAWNFLKKETPQFDLVVLCPPMVYGPLQHTIGHIAELNESNSRILNLFINSSKNAQLPSDGIHLYVDVRDLALAHVLSAKNPAAANKRMIISGGKVASQDIADILRENFDVLKDRCPIGNPGVSSLQEDAYDADVSHAKDILGLRFRPAERTFVDLARQLLKIEQQTN